MGLGILGVAGLSEGGQLPHTHTHTHLNVYCVLWGHKLSHSCLGEPGCVLFLFLSTLSSFAYIVRN